MEKFLNQKSVHEAYHIICSGGRTKQGTATLKYYPHRSVKFLHDFILKRCFRRWNEV